MAIKKGSVKTNASEVAKTEATKGEKSVVEKILIENLVPDPNNGEDISVTVDLERSIKKNGFLDPIVVTDFGMEEGKYRIVSGHRRTEAMKKLKEIAIPCLIQHFNSEEEVASARQSFNNATRDSSKDPLMMVRRWKMFSETHDELSEGKKVEEFAEDCGMSKQTVERYKALAKLISPIQQMWADETVGYSSIIPIATLEADNQNEVYNIMVMALKENEDILTRPNVKAIVDAYKKGTKTWEEIKETVFQPISHGENKNEEEADEIGMNPPTEEAEESDSNTDTENEEAENNSDDSNSDTENENEYDGVDTDEAKAFKKAKELSKTVDKLKDIAEREIYHFQNDDDGKTCIANMLDLASTLLVRAQEISEDVDGGYDTFMQAKHNFYEELKNNFPSDLKNVQK